MKTIWKYYINQASGRPMAVNLPLYGSVVKFGIQENILYIWVEFDKDETQMKERIFQIFGTGQNIPPNANHIETIFEESSVWHLYEI